MGRAWSWLSTLALVASILMLPRIAWADGANDEVLRTLILEIYEAEVSTQEYDGALANLDAARGVCEGGACSDEAQAELLVAIGTVQALAGKTGAAKKSFADALKLDPGAKLDPKFGKGKAKKLWSAAKGDREEEVAEGCRGSYEGQRRTGRRWSNAEAYFCYQQAEAASEAEEYESCAADARAALELEENLQAKELLATCLEKDNRWAEAIAEWEQIRREAPRKANYSLGRKAASRAAVLQRRMPALVLRPPKDVDDLVVKLDGTELPIEVLEGEGEIPVDPGEHEVDAKGKQDGTPVGFAQTILLEPNDTITVLLTLTPGNPDPGTQKILKCLASGKTPEQCLQSKSAAKGGGDLSFRLGTEVSGYIDDMDVQVVAPNLTFGIEHVTDGWGLTGSFLIDVVTAASTDIVATASPRWRELRYVPSLSGHKKFGDVDISLRGNLSREPDYLATSVGTTVSAELAQKTVTPSLGFEFSYDLNGVKQGESQSSYLENARHIKRYAINAGLGLVLDKATFGSMAFTAVIEDGDSTKLYRHIPMFSDQVAPAVPAGLVVEAVNFYRLDLRPLEQLPTSRKRFGLAASVAHRFADSTIRATERLYLDTWGTKATTTDARFMYDVVKEFRIWPHGRFHAQTAADFYRLAYVAQRAPDGTWIIPQYRSGDRELGPLISFTLGGGARYEFGERREMGIMLTGDFIYTRFLDHLFVKERLGYFGALGFDGEFE